MNPEKRLLVIPEYLAVKALVFIIAALVRVLRPKRVNVIYRHGTFYDFDLLLGGRYLNGLFFALVVFFFLGLCIDMNVLDDFICLFKLGLVYRLVFFRCVCL